MKGHLCLVLHAHLPFVRHPEHEQFLEENWLFEAITESYIPLLKVLQGWQQSGVGVHLTMTLSPTLCSMLMDPLLQARYLRHLETLIELADKEVHRTRWEPAFHSLALFYHERLNSVRDFYRACRSDLVSAFRACQEGGQLEIITTAATHAILPLLASHPPSVRAQILVARDHYRHCFGREPKGIWLPECAYAEGLESFLGKAKLRWFILDSHGLLNAKPRPRFGTFAPILTPHGLAVFGRDMASARQVWSREEGYPGDVRYRDFYRDIGFDLDLDYVRPHLATSDRRSFTGIKYHRITGPGPAKQIYDRPAALDAAEQQAAHFLDARKAQIERLAAAMKRPPVVLSPYDAELFGHWWYEGPEFLDRFARKAFGDQDTLSLITPEEYLGLYPTQQVATPGASSWGEEGYWKMWLDDANHWIYQHLSIAQKRMSNLAARFVRPDPLQGRALRQAARELLLAQASDWPFIIRTGTSPDYARNRVTTHLLRFTSLHEQLLRGVVDEQSLAEMEWKDNCFPEINYRYWANVE